MSWGEVTKINDNLNIPLNKLIGSNFNMLVNNVSGDTAGSMNINYNTHAYYDSMYKYCKPLNSINEHIDRTLFSSNTYYDTGFVVYVDDVEYGIKIEQLSNSFYEANITLMTKPDRTPQPNKRPASYLT